jgi:hypothetical protein
LTCTKLDSAEGTGGVSISTYLGFEPHEVTIAVCILSGLKTRVEKFRATLERLNMKRESELATRNRRVDGIGSIYSVQISCFVSLNKLRSSAKVRVGLFSEFRTKLPEMRAIGHVVFSHCQEPIAHEA